MLLYPKWKPAQQCGDESDIKHSECVSVYSKFTRPSQLDRVQRAAGAGG